MTPSRWDWLDHEPPPAATAVGPAAEPAVRESLASNPPGFLNGAHPYARSLFHLRQLDACVDFLESSDPDGLAPADRWLLGCALGRTGRTRQALAVLRTAERDLSGEPDLRASRLSAELALGLPAVGERDAPGALRTLSGAAFWRAAQLEFRADRCSAAALAFLAAGDCFSREAVAGDWVESRVACYIGGAVAELCSEFPDNARSAYTRLLARVPLKGRACGELARAIHELAGDLAAADEAERLLAVAPLKQLVDRATVTVGFYVPPIPPAVAWLFPLESS